MFPCEAAGIGQLVRAHNIAVAADSTLQIVHVTRWPHEMLELVGLLTLLGADTQPQQRHFEGWIEEVDTRMSRRPANSYWLEIRHA